MNYWLFIIPVIAAFIGWLATRTMIRALFHPLQPRKILGITVQGIFPKRQQQLAEKLGRSVSAEFASFVDIEQKISDPKKLTTIMPVIEDHIDDFLRNRLGKEMPVISMFIGDKTIDKLKIAFMKEIGILFPQLMKQYAANLKNELNLEQLVVKKIADLSSNKLEEILHREMSKEFRSLKIAGAVIGFIIGAIQVIITILIA